MKNTIRSLFNRRITVSAISLVLLTAFLMPVASAEPRITTAAGGAGTCGNGGDAAYACLNAPTNAVIDPAGDLIVADFSNNQIRRIDSVTGVINALAGTGVSGFGGDGGSALNAQLKLPWDVATDADGNVYIVDRNNQRIRVVNTQASSITVAGVTIGSGNIRTIAGNGAAGYGGDGGPATSATLNTPLGIAVDASGNIFVADINNHRVRMIDAGGTISTVAGTGTAGFSGDGGLATSAQLNSPSDVALDATGNLYISERQNHRIRVVNRQSSAITVHGVTVAAGAIATIVGDGANASAGDGGLATSASVEFVDSVVVDSATGYLYLADRAAHVIRRVDSAGYISTIAGTTDTFGFSGDGGSAATAVLNLPFGLAADENGNLYVADYGNNRIRAVNTQANTDTLLNVSIDAGNIATVAGNGATSFSGVDVAPAAATLNGPWGVAVDASGNFYFVDRDNHQVRVVNTQPSPITVAGVAIDPGKIKTIAGTGTAGYGGDGGPATAARLNTPLGVAVDASGNIFVADINNQRVRMIDGSGTISTVAGNGTAGFGGDGGAATAAQLNSPSGVAVDAAGNLYVSERQNHRVRVVNRQGSSITVYGVTVAPGAIATVVGNGTNASSGDGGLATAASIQFVDSVAIDPVTGDLYFSDRSAHVVRSVNSAGFISTIAGTNSVSGFSGDGGPAVNSTLNTPFGIGLDSSGILYIADYGNHRARAVNLSGNTASVLGVTIASNAIATVAGSGAAGYGGDNGLPTNAALGSPVALAVDVAGKVYVSDFLNNRIRRAADYGSTLRTTATPSGKPFNSPISVSLVASDPTATIYYSTDDWATTNTYAGPITISSDTTLRFYADDGLGNVEPEKVEVYTLDTVVPTTSASPVGGTYGSAQSVTLATDEPATIYYTTDGSTPTTSSGTYVGPISVTADTTIKFFAVDIAGNVESVKTETYTIVDLTAPTVTATPAGGSYNTTQSVTLTADEAATIYYTIDGSTPTTSSPVYSSPIGISADTTLKFFGVDSVGNVEAVQTAVYVIDTVKPTTTASFPGGTYGTTITVTLTADEPAVIRYTTNNTTPNISSPVYSGPLDITLSTRLQYFATDTAGNVEAVKSQVYYIDLTPPTTTASLPAGNYSGPQSVTLAADETATIYYTTDGTTPTTASTVYSGPITVLAAGASQTTLQFFAVDTVGHTESVKTLVYTDNSPTTTASPSGGVLGGPQTVTLNANEPATIYYTTDGSTPTTSSAVYSGGISVLVSTTIKFFGVDAFGHVEAVKTEVYTMDDTTAAVTTSSPAAGVYAIPQSVRLSASEPATTIYYTTDGTAPTTASAVYSVPITVPSNTTIKYFSVDNAGNPEAVNTAGYTIDNTVANILTVGGAGAAGYSGDDAPAILATLNLPWGVTTDADGNIYIADRDNHRIRVINVQATPVVIAGVTVNPGDIATIAGTGTAGYTGSGGPATAALLNTPLGVAVDGAGNIYIADINNQRVRQVHTNGVITTVAGTGVAGFGGDGGPATAAELYSPSGVAVDADGNLYISERQNHRIRVVNRQLTPITVYGVTVDPGNIATVVGDGANASAGDGGSATAASIQFVDSIAISQATGDLYLADRSANVVRKVNSAGIITTVAGTNNVAGYSGDGGPATAATLSLSFGIAVDSAGNVFIADYGNNRVRVVNLTGSSATILGISVDPGNIATVAGTGTAGYGGDNGPATAALLKQPVALAVDNSGGLLITDYANNRIRRVAGEPPIIVVGTPLAADDDVTTDEDTAVTADVVTNDDLGVQPTAITAVTQGANGTVTFDAGNGTTTYTPAADFNGSDSYTYTITDNNGVTSTATVTVTVTAVNDAPTATSASITTDEDTTSVGVTPSVTDVDDTSFTFAIVSQGANGTAAVVGNQLVYTPNADFNGADSFTYSATDGGGLSVTGTASVNVNAVNDAPSATSASITTDEDTASAGVTPSVTDVDDTSFTFAIVSQGANGTASVVGNQLVYTPNADFNGADSFTYSATDGGGLSVTGTATVNVNAVNDAPTATSASITTDEDTTSAGVTPSVTDVDDTSFTFAIVSQGANGTAAVVGNQLVYTPNADFNGSDSFTYSATDGGGLSVTGTASVTVNAVNDAPTATSASITTDEDTTSAGVTPSVSDIDDTSFTFAIVSQGANGTAAVVGGQLVYTPNADFNGADSFTYSATDGGGLSVTGTATVSVNAVNDAPTATSASITTDEDTTSAGVTPSVTDVDDTSFTFGIVSQPVHGSAAVVGNQLVYTPSADYYGADSFAYSATDGGGLSVTGTAVVSVNAVNDAPTAASASIATGEDTTSAGVTPSVTDVDDTSFTIAIVTQPAYGLAAIVGNQLVYTPSADFFGADSFTFSATDSGGLSVTGTADVSVAPVNDAPTATSASITTDEDTASTGVTPSVSDVDDTSFTFAIVSQGANGTASVVGGQLVYTPNADFNGADSFIYSATDSGGLSVNGTASVTVISVNDAPVANDDSYGTESNTPLTTGNVLANDTDVDGDTLSVSAVDVGTVNGGAIVDNHDGTFTYTPAANYTGTDSFSYTVSDGQGGTDTGTVTVTVTDTVAPTTVADPAGGTYAAAQSVTLTADEPATIYYTTDGSTPSTGSLVYTGPIYLAANTTLQFFAVDGSGNTEAVNTETYVIDTTAPVTTASPVGGTYTAAQSVTLTTDEPATIHYTIDGTTPTLSSPVYSGAINISVTTTLQFFAVDAVGNAEYVNMEYYVIDIPPADTTPPVTTASPAGGTYTSVQSVTLTADETATIYYTTDGSTPTTGSTVYGGPISLSADTTLKFFAVDTAGNAEAVKTEVYVIDLGGNTVHLDRVKISPHHLNLGSQGSYVKAKLYLDHDERDEHGGYGARDGRRHGHRGQEIDASTVRLTLTDDPNCALCNIPPVTGSGHHDDDEAQFKFDRQAVQAMIATPGTVSLTVYGNFTDGTPFEGSDTIHAQ